MISYVKKQMKKDILIICLILLIILFVVNGTEIQSVEEYYLIHIDDIREDSKTVFISIRCDSVFSHYDMLDPSLKKEGVLPSDGIILPISEYVLRDGDTVFDILDRVTRHNRIQMEYQGAEKNGFGSVHVEGISYLYSFSCGPISGWTYTVNGKAAGLGSSLYELSDGDVIEWVYTCELGEDVGSAVFGETGGKNGDT